MAATKPPEPPKRGEWLLVEDGDEGRLFFIVTNVLKKGTTIKQVHGENGPRTLNPAARRHRSALVRRS